MLFSKKPSKGMLIKTRRARQSLLASALAIATIFFATGPSNAIESSLIYVINVDVMPPFTKEAMNILKEYRTTSLKEKGAKRIELLQRLEHGNHYAMIEEWDNQADYDAHISAEATRNFRTRLQPMLGSPFDERVHHSFE